MGLIEAVRFCCFIIEFVMLHCNNVLRVFPICSMRVCGVISDWRLIPVRDWLVCSPLVWFFAGSFGGAPFCFISAPILMEVRSLRALMPCFSVVYCCAFLAVSIALQKGYVFWPWSSEFFAWGLLNCVFCYHWLALDFVCLSSWAAWMAWILLQFCRFLECPK